MPLHISEVFSVPRDQTRPKRQMHVVLGWTMCRAQRRNESASNARVHCRTSCDVRTAGRGPDDIRFMGVACLPRCCRHLSSVEDDMLRHFGLDGPPCQVLQHVLHMAHLDTKEQIERLCAMPCKVDYVLFSVTNTRCCICAGHQRIL